MPECVYTVHCTICCRDERLLTSATNRRTVANNKLNQQRLVTSICRQCGTMPRLTLFWRPRVKVFRCIVAITACLWFFFCPQFIHSLCFVDTSIRHQISVCFVPVEISVYRSGRATTRHHSERKTLGRCQAPEKNTTCRTVTSERLGGW